MTLISSIIADAYREANMLPLGKDPTANQSAEALRLYNALLAAIYGGDAGEPLTDWPLGNFDRDPNSPWYELPWSPDRLHNPPINQRLIAVNESAVTIWLSPRPQDGSRMGIIDPFSRLSTAPITLNGNGRPIEGAASIVLNVDGTEREWFYRADKGQWVKLVGVLATDENPFPDKYDTFFIVMLAMRLSPRYGRTLAAETLAIFKQNKAQFVARYLQSRPLEIDDSISWPFMSRQGYDTQRAFSTTRGFQRGNPCGD